MISINVTKVPAIKTLMTIWKYPPKSKVSSSSVAYLKDV